MPMLSNARHERFAQALAAGKSATDAYAEAGYNGGRTNAARLATKDYIQARVQELQERAVEGVILTKQWVLDRLMENVKRSMQHEAVMDKEGAIVEYRYDGSVANRALELLGKELKMFIERAEVGAPGDFVDLGERELFERIQREAEELGVPIGETSH